VQTLALAIHELATNALKYGALAGTEGKLNIVWSVRDSENGHCLELEWTENVGDGTLPGAKTRYTLDSHGVHCTIELALEPERARRAKRWMCRGLPCSGADS
jgi:two-component system CheB/CheR fusion protein